MATNEWVTFSPPERSRTYRWVTGDGEIIGHYTGVKRMRVSSSGNHYLECDQGHIIVAPGWSRIELDIDAWTF